MTATVRPEAEKVTRPRPTRRRRRAASPRRRAGIQTFGHWWWAVPGVVLTLAVHYAATGVGGFFAFTDWTGIGSFRLVGLENFTRVLSDSETTGALTNTLFLAITSVVLTNVFGLALAVGLNRGLRSRYVLRVLFFMPVVLSPLAVSYIWKFIFEYNGPLNGLLSFVGLGDLARPWLGDPTFAIWAVLVVFVWQNTGFMMVIYAAGLAAVPVEIEEAAALDGATMWRRFRSITLPCIRPAAAIATTLGLVNGLRLFDQIIALTGGGPAGATDTLATLMYKEAFALGNFGYGAALALLLTVLILVFAVTQQRVAGGRPAKV